MTVVLVTGPAISTYVHLRKSVLKVPEGRSEVTMVEDILRLNRPEAL